MRANVKFIVPREQRLTVTFEMTIEEMQELLKHTSDMTVWPTGPFRTCLQQALNKAHEAYYSEHLFNA